MDFLQTEYSRDVTEIAKYTEPGSQFERDAIAETADRHGTDPLFVARDVAFLRGTKDN